MVAMIGHWVRSLIIIVLLGNLADFILPKGDLKKYAGLIIGLVLLLAMVSPVWSIIHQLGKSRSSSAWLGVGTGQNLSVLVHSEQIDQAEAMVLSYKNVESCVIHAGPGGWYSAVVTVTAPVVKTTLSQYIKDALAITTGQTPRIQLSVQTSEKIQPSAVHRIHS